MLLTLPLGSEEVSVAKVLEHLKGRPGTYKIILNDGTSYTGKAVTLYKRLMQHFRNKFKWKDVRAICTEDAKTETKRRIREAERLLEETKGLHPSDAPNVHNQRMPPKP